MPTSKVVTAVSQAMDHNKGRWGTISIQVPDFLESTRDAINNVAQFLVSVLDIVQAALQLVKSFLVGYLDPILAFLQQVIDYISNLLRDLRQLGLYITGDWRQLKYPYQELKGGYQAYEQRMIARMVDRTDTTRPDLTSNTKVFSLWFYLSADVSEIERLIDFVRQMMQFFGHKFIPEGTPPVPVITKVLYNADAVSIIQPKTLGEFFKADLGLPSVALVKWKINTTASENMFNPFPPLPPGGFIVTVSTFQDGIPLFFDRPQVAAGTKNSAVDDTTKVQPRDYGVVYGPTLQPLVLHGGIDMIQMDADTYGYNSSLDSTGNVKPNRTRFYGVLSPSARTVIPLECLSTAGVNNFQKTFYVPFAMVGQFMTGEFQFALPLSEMPRAAKMTAQADGTMKVEATEEHASIVYVRVASCTKDVGNQKTPFVYDFTSPASFPSPVDKVWPVALLGNLSSTAVSPFSAPARITFPNANTKDYFTAVETAIVVLALCRPDFETLAERLPTLSPEEQKILKNGMDILPHVAGKACGLESFRHLLGELYKDPQKEFAAKGVMPIQFRQDLFARARKFAYDVYDLTGPMPDLERSVVQGTAFLRTATMKQILSSSYDTTGFSYLWDNTLLEMLDPSKGGLNLDAGFAINRNSMCVTEDTADELLDIDGVYQLRAPQYLEAPIFLPNDPTFQPKMEFDSYKDLQDARVATNPGLRAIYDQAQRVAPDSDKWVIPSTYAGALSTFQATGGKRGSCDDEAPVLYINQQALAEGSMGTSNNRAVIFARGLLTAANNGQLVSEALFALGVAASALHRSSKDGQWITYRFMDSLTGIDDFLWALQSWLEAIKNSIQSIVDTIKKYIEYLEGRITEMQQFIQRINGLIQSVLQNIFVIPKCAAMMLYSDGTGGMVADFVSAKNKPSDTPLAYGAGVGVVFPIPLVGLIGDILLAIFDTNSSASGDSIAGPLPPAAIVANPPVPVSPVEPDVL